MLSVMLLRIISSRFHFFQFLYLIYTSRTKYPSAPVATCVQLRIRRSPPRQNIYPTPCLATLFQPVLWNVHSNLQPFFFPALLQTKTVWNKWCIFSKHQQTVAKIFPSPIMRHHWQDMLRVRNNREQTVFYTDVLHVTKFKWDLFDAWLRTKNLVENIFRHTVYACLNIWRRWRMLSQRRWLD